MFLIKINGPIIENNNKWFYEWLEYDATCPKDIEAALDQANGEDVLISINSGGGSVFAGSEIYELIRSYTGKIKIKVVGCAASAASVIAQAAESEIAPTALFMIHNAKSYAEGDYRDMDKQSEFLKQVNTAITNAYIEKTGMKREDLFDLMNQETWMTAQDAVKNGFINSISENNNYESNLLKQTDIYNSANGISNDCIQKIRHKLMEKEGLTKNEFLEAPFSIKNHGGNKNMNLQQLLEENPTAMEEYTLALSNAKKEGEEKERNRMKDIDAIAKTIPDDMVTEAKYKGIMEAKDLAMQLLLKNQELGGKYLKDALEDGEQSNIEDVTTQPEERQDDEEEETVNMIAHAMKETWNERNREV